MYKDRMLIRRVLFSVVVCTVFIAMCYAEKKPAEDCTYTAGTFRFVSLSIKRTDGWTQYIEGYLPIKKDSLELSFNNDSLFIRDLFKVAYYENSIEIALLTPYIYLTNITSDYSIPLDKSKVSLYYQDMTTYEADSSNVQKFTMKNGAEVTMADVCIVGFFIRASIYNSFWGVIDKKNLDSEHMLYPIPDNVDSVQSVLGYVTVTKVDPIKIKPITD